MKIIPAFDTRLHSGRGALRRLNDPRNIGCLFAGPKFLPVMKIDPEQRAVRVTAARQYPV